MAYLEELPGESLFTQKEHLQGRLALQSSIRVNYKTSGTMSSEQMRSKWRCLTKTKHRISAQTPPYQLSSMVVEG